MKRKHFFKKTFLLVCLSITIGCTPKQEQPQVSNDDQQVVQTNDNENQEPVQERQPLSQEEQQLADMSLEEKIGQLFIIRPESLDFSLSAKKVHDPKKYGITKMNQTMIDGLKEYPVGGIVMFNKNITSPRQITSYIEDFQKNSQIPLFIAIDEEGGSISRIANTSTFQVKKYKNMTSIGNTKDTNKAKDVGVTIGTYLKKYGFNLDFAPDADVNTNPKNPVIGTRSFGKDPTLVANMVSATIDGFHSVNMTTCIKHFPGHGDTQTDSHLGYAGTKKTWDQMLKCELIPFQQNMDKTDMIMVSHITAEKVTTDHLPSSLSYEMISERLRNELNYDGIVITDSLAMKAITDQYSSQEAAVKSFQAGSDILLMPNDYREAFQGILDAVKDGDISEDRINESVLKILKLKSKISTIQKNNQIE